MFRSAFTATPLPRARESPSLRSDSGQARLEESASLSAASASDGLHDPGSTGSFPASSSRLPTLESVSRILIGPRLSSLAYSRLFSFSTDSIYLATYNYVRPLPSTPHSLTTADFLPSPVLQLGDVYNRYSSSAQAAQRCALRPFLDSPPDADCPCHSTSVCCETSLEQSSLVRLSLAVVLPQRPCH